MADYKTIDDYISAQTQQVRDMLITLKKCILEVVPDAEETFNYNIPAFTLIKSGKREQQIMMAGFNKHVGLYPHPTTMERFAQELIGYKQGKGSVQFPLDQPLPCELIAKMVRYRKQLLDENRLLKRGAQID